MTSTCPSPSKLLLLLEGQGLDPSPQEHLAGCFDCQAALASLAEEEAAPRVDEPLAGRYVLEERVGEGAYAEVWRARDSKLGRAVAVKLLRERISDELPAVLRFLREARLLAQLAAPHVVRVYDSGVSRGRPFLVTEWLAGGTLEGWLGKPRGWRQVVRVFLQVGQGLHDAHRQGVVHRDVKPANVLLDEQGAARVADFGLASQRDGGLDPAPSLSPMAALPLSQSGSVAGTPLYLAPELLGGEPATPRSDQFSFFVSLYESLEQARPFAGLPHQSGWRPFARTPRALRRVLRRGLAQRPDERFPDLGAACLALERVLKRRRRAVVGGAAVLLLSAAAAAGALVPSVQTGLACRRDGAELSSSPAERLELLQRLAQDPLVKARGHVEGFLAQWDEAFQTRCLAASTEGLTHWPGERECLRRQMQHLRTLEQVLVAGKSKSPGAMFDELPEPKDCRTRAAAYRVPRPGEAALLTPVRKDIGRLAALRTAGELREALREAEEIAELARINGFLELEAEAALYVAQGAYFLNDEQRARKLAEELLVTSERLGLDAVRMEALFMLAFLRGARQGQSAEGLALFAQAEALAHRLSVPVGPELHYNKATLLFHAGEREASVPVYEEGLAHFERSGKKSPLQVHLLRGLARSHQWQHRARRAVELYRRAEQLTVELGQKDSLLAASVQNDLATALADAGRLTEALGLLRGARELGERVGRGPSINQLITLGHVGALTSEVGSLEEGRRQLEEVIASFRARYAAQPELTAPALRALAQAHFHAGDLRAGLEAAKQSLQAASDVAKGARLARETCRWGQALGVAGRAAEAASVLEPAAKSAASLPEGPERWCLDGALLVLRPDEAEAPKLAQRMVAADTLSARLTLALVQTVLAQQALREHRAHEAHVSEGLRLLEGAEGRRAAAVRQALEAAGKKKLVAARVLP